MAGSAVAFLQSIASRIFGLAVVLLILTIALAGFLSWHVTGLAREFRVVAERDLPLQSCGARLDEAGLRRRLAFERWFGALNAAQPNKEIVAEAEANYARYTEELKRCFTEARELLARHAGLERSQKQLLSIGVLLTQIEASYPLITTRQKEVLELQRQGAHEQANTMITGLNDLQLLVQTQRNEIQRRTADISQTAARDVERQERTAKLLAIAATVSTVLLGLVVAALVSNRLVRPVQSLIRALRDVQQGRLDLDLPVRTRDEVGDLTNAFNFFVSELRSKEELKQTFGKYVDPRILEHLLLAPEAAEAAGGRHVMTVSFADIAGFSSISEQLTPTLMVKLLNRHFGLQAQAVQEHQGVVDKFIGDSIMAFWGPPFVASAEHAVLACHAALAQLTALDALRTDLAELTGLRRNTPTIELRLGIATGEVVVGNIGSENTRSYTVIGDTVNLASRLESANRLYGTRILLSENVARDAGPQFELREVDAIAVKGKIEPVQIFELLGTLGCLSEEKQRARESFAEGLRAYRAADWAAAQIAFSRNLELQPADQPSRVMLERIALLRARPSSESWDGVWRPDSK